MSKYEEVKQGLLNEPKTWLVTGAAGFIGSNLVEALLLLNQMWLVWIIFRLATNII